MLLWRLCLALLFLYMHCIVLTIAHTHTHSHTRTQTPKHCCHDVCSNGNAKGSDKSAVFEISKSNSILSEMYVKNVFLFLVGIDSVRICTVRGLHQTALKHELSITASSGSFTLLLGLYCIITSNKLALGGASRGMVSEI